MLSQKYTGEHHVATVRDFYEHHTVPPNKSYMFNLQRTIWAAETICHEHLDRMLDRQMWPHKKAAARQGGMHTTCVSMMERTNATAQLTTHSGVVKCMVSV